MAAHSGEYGELRGIHALEQASGRHKLFYTIVGAGRSDVAGAGARDASRPDSYRAWLRKKVGETRNSSLALVGVLAWWIRAMCTSPALWKGLHQFPSRERGAPTQIDQPRRSVPQLLTSTQIVENQSGPKNRCQGEKVAEDRTGVARASQNSGLDQEARPRGRVSVRLPALAGPSSTAARHLLPAAEGGAVSTPASEYSPHGVPSRGECIT